MSSSVKKSFMCAIVLVIIAVVSVGLLSLANAFFPEYVPVLDLETVTELNAISPTGVSDQEAYDNEYFDTITMEDIDDWNKDHAISVGDSVLAVYQSVKGDSIGDIFVYTETSGYKSGLRLIIGIDTDGILLGISVIQSLEDNYSNSDLVDINSFIYGKESITATEFKEYLSISAGGGATRTATGFVNAINLALDYYLEVGSNE